MWSRFRKRTSRGDAFACACKKVRALAAFTRLQLKQYLRSNREVLAWGLLAVALILSTLWEVSHWARKLALQDVRERGTITLNLIAENLRGELSKFKIQPQLLAINPKYAAVLRGPATVEQIQDVNVELERINNASGALDTYLMDATGLTIAASNWNSAKPFVGRNFNYRPYFQEAMLGRLTARSCRRSRSRVWVSLKRSPASSTTCARTRRHS